MRAGLIRVRGQFQSRVDGQDELGAPNGEFAEFWTCWAAVIPLTGNEQFQAQQRVADVTHRIEIRFKEGITPEMRFVYTLRNTQIVLDVLALMIQESRCREMHLLAKQWQ